MILIIIIITMMRGISIVPWKNGKSLTWDATWPNTYVPSHQLVAARGFGEVAEHSEHAKRLKCIECWSRSISSCLWLHVETSRVFVSEAFSYLCESG